MTDDEIRIAVAEACGWKPYYEKGNTPWIENAEFYSPSGKFSILADLPDYPNDLNAMHEAEKVLTDAQRCNYASRLHPVEVHHFAQADFMVAHSEARRRAIEFLRTLGKWKD